MKTINKLGIVILFFAYNLMYAQAPFTSLIKEPRYIKEITTNEGKKGYNAATVQDFTDNKNKTSEIYLFEKKIDPITQKETFVPVEQSSAQVTLINTQKMDVKEAEKQEIDFFKNNALSLSILSKGDNRASVSSEVVHYKLYFNDPNESNTTQQERYNIPLFVIAKLSSTYDSINSAAALDVLDYEAAPLTLRIMPSWKIYSPENKNDVAFFGFYTDLRGLNMYNSQTNDYSVEVVGSGGFGFTYQSAASAGIYNDKGEYEQGKYSLSVILQGATGKKEVLGSLFDTDKDVVGSFQSYLMIKVAKESKLNLKIGYQYLFVKTLAGNKANFSVALGI